MLTFQGFGKDVRAQGMSGIILRCLASWATFLALWVRRMLWLDFKL